MTLAQSDGWIGRWSPGIGDPTIVGWVTVICYFVGAWQCYRLAAGHSVALNRRERTIWWALALGLAGLGINKQLDLQSAMTEIGRFVAIRQGWFEGRHEVQKLFVEGVAAVAACIAIAGAYLARKAPPATTFALVGGILLLGFVVMRAASFHHIDDFIRSEWLGISANGVIELGGICIIFASALWRARYRRDPQREQLP